MTIEEAITLTVAAMDARLAARAAKGPVCRQHAHKTHARRFTALWGDRRVDRLGRWEIAGWVEQRRQEVAGATVQHELAFLGKMFTTVIEQALAMEEQGGDPGHELRANPCKGLTRGLTKSPVLPRYIKRSEEQALEKHADPWAFSVLEFGNLTGLRALELFALAPEHLDFDMQVINLQHSKTGPRVIPLHPYAADIARTWIEKRPGPWLFYPERPGRSDMVAWFRRTRLGPAVKAAGLKGITPRLFRSTFASRLVQAGESLYVVQQLLGHKSPTQTQRYSALAASNLRRAVQRLKV